MYCPAFYLEKITDLVNQGNFLYHWTTLSNAKNIIQNKCIYSKGTLFGMDPKKNSSILAQHPDLKADTENGFIDYVFLGNTNWVEEKLQSYYGKVGFVINPLNLLRDIEFYVFPFNTGRYYKNALNEHKYSDLTTLKDALSKKTKNYEILVKGKVAITHNTEKILCDSSSIIEIDRALSSSNLYSIKTEEY
ncbi:TPA: hypothetical protein KLD84_000295 [Legionella pneumophila]|nr:hypothetical protein [Legionella pneumophila]